MNKVYILSFICLLGILFSSAGCKKDYPSDIPEWLKEDIQRRRKEKDCGKGSLVIYERKVNSSGDFIYEYYYMNSNDSHFYDSNGVTICAQSGISASCMSYKNNSNFVRVVWDPTEICK